jgi:hypothetical protein
MLADKGVAEAATEQVRDVQAGVQRSLRNYEGKSVGLAGERIPAKWTLKRRVPNPDPAIVCLACGKPSDRHYLGVQSLPDLSPPLGPLAGSAAGAAPDAIE